MRILPYCMKLLRLRTRLFLYLSTFLEGLLMGFWKASPIGEWQRMTQGKFTNSLLMHSITFIASALLIEISNSKMLCLTRETMSSLLILASQHVFPMNRKSKYFAEPRVTWRQRLCRKQNFVVHQLISMLQEFYCLRSSVVNSHIEARMTRNSIKRLAMEIWTFQIMCHLVLGT